MTLTECATRPLCHPLSARELEVLRHVAHGCGNKQIAACLHISEQTVKNHITAINLKLQVQSRTEAVITALRLTLLSLSDIPESGDCLPID